MKIQRDGKEYTLTAEEVMEAHEEFVTSYKWANIEFCTNLSHKLKSFFEWGAAFYEAVQVCKLFLL